MIHLDAGWIKVVIKVLINVSFAGYMADVVSTDCQFFYDVICDILCNWYVYLCRSVEVSSQQVKPVAAAVAVAAAAAAAAATPVATETVSTPPESAIVVVQGNIVQFKVFT